MKKRILLLTKDAMCRDYLPVYGNQLWKGKTPNLDELAEKGTVFMNCYTAAPSTAMAFLGLSTQKFPYQLDIHDYVPLKKEFNNNIYNDAKKKGYKCHILWDSRGDDFAKKYTTCFGGAQIHSLPNLGQPVGMHFPHKDPLQIDEAKSVDVCERIEKVVLSILDDEPFYLWIHLPHVINGRISYGGDIDVFDTILGMLRKYFPDDAIYIGADHGNMNGSHGALSYGYDAYDQAIRIPLITPRLKCGPVMEDSFSLVDLYKLMFENKLTHRKMIFADTAYYKQPHRKLAIISGNYKYIYNKLDNSEELYDVAFDPNEGINLLSDMYKDSNRNLIYPLRDLLTYPEWDDLHLFLDEAREEKKRIWKQDGPIVAMLWKIRHQLGVLEGRLDTFIKNKLAAKK